MNTQTVGAQHCCAPTNTMCNQPDLISAVITYRGENVRLISVRRDRLKELRYGGFVDVSRVLC